MSELSKAELVALAVESGSPLAADALGKLSKEQLADFVAKLRAQPKAGAAVAVADIDRAGDLTTTMVIGKRRDAIATATSDGETVSLIQGEALDGVPVTLADGRIVGQRAPKGAGETEVRACAGFAGADRRRRAQRGDLLSQIGRGEAVTPAVIASLILTK